MAITLDGDNLSTVGVINSATAKASTSGTSIDFTGIPSGVKRITVMFNGVSLSGSSSYLIQLGAGSVQTTSYLTASYNTGGSGSSAYTNGFGLKEDTASFAVSGSLVFTLLNASSNIWTGSGSVCRETNGNMITAAGKVTLTGTLDRVRITTVNGTDTFDAGSINILYE